jgi:hypothetical protein
VSYLREKSGFNISAAEELINNSIYASSVHCSYYGCFQFLKYTIKNYKNFSYDYIENECFNYAGGTHGYIIDTCLNEYRKKVNLNSYKDLKRNIKDLKEFRISSDYYNLEISIDQGEKSLSLSKSIIAEIKKTLK